MKFVDIVVGGRYSMMVSRKLQVIRVIELKEILRRDRRYPRIYAINEATGRNITIRSPQRLRARVGS